jgi:murein DD-endopeptidase MepM/ murein hydrolase activator NlpD
MASLYSVPWNAPGNLAALIYAEDAAGNRKTQRVPLQIRNRRPRAEEIRVSDKFIRTKIEPLLIRYEEPVPETPAEAYLAVNRTMRKQSEIELQALLASSAPQLLTPRALQQQRGTQVGSRFAEHRTYTYEGEPIDEQTHLGYDLASVRRAPVEAAGDGQIEWVGELGIYGKVVLIDHGLGLATLYAHLSEIDVEPGMRITRGDVIGRSGETGLAGGDHLHFSVTLRGHHVDPLEWWDAQWVEREILEPLRQAGAQGP